MPILLPLWAPSGTTSRGYPGPEPAAGEASIDPSGEDGGIGLIPSASETMAMVVKEGRALRFSLRISGRRLVPFRRYGTFGLRLACDENLNRRQRPHLRPSTGRVMLVGEGLLEYTTEAQAGTVILAWLDARDLRH